MIKGLTGAGLGPLPSVMTLLKKAKDYGFQAVDLDPIGMMEELGEEQSVLWLKEHEMRIGAIGLPVNCLGDDEQFRSSLPKLAVYSEAAHKLGCRSCCTYILPSTDHKPAQYMAQLIRRYRICADILEAYGIRLGLEYVGPHHLRTAWSHPFIWTMEETLDMIAAIGRPNVGLLLDSYHWYTTGQTAEDLLQLTPEQIVHVHLNDAEANSEEALDNDRRYPGEGRIDLSGFLQALRKVGYEGPVSQEVLTKEAPVDSLDQLLERSRRGFDKVWREAGIE